MKIFVTTSRFFTFLIFLSLTWAQVVLANEAITIGLQPSGDLEMTKTQAFLLAEKLQEKMNKPVQVYITKNYKGLMEAIKTKKVDFAFFSAMTFVESEKETGLKVLLKKTWEGPYYFAALVTLKKSKLINTKNLKNKRIVFVDQDSTSGFLYPQLYLKNNNISQSVFKSIVFSGSHAHSIELLESGQADVAAVFADDEKGKTGAWTRFAKNKNSEFKTIWVSSPIPNDPIVVRDEFYKANSKIADEVMYSLIELQHDPLMRPKVSEILGRGDLIPATSQQYEIVREMVKSLKAPQNL